MEQAHGVGHRSIHFDSLNDIYASFENSPDQITIKGIPYNFQLDNGEKYPEKKAFTNVNFPDAYTFNGEIDWATPEKTSFLGIQKAVYKFTIGQGWQRIENGTLTLVHKDPDMPDRVLQLGPGTREHYTVQAVHGAMFMYLYRFLKYLHATVMYPFIS